MRFLIECFLAVGLMLLISRGLFNYTPGFIMGPLLTLPFLGVIHGIVEGFIAMRARVSEKFSEWDLELIKEIDPGFYLANCSFEVIGGCLDIRIPRIGVWIYLMKLGEGEYKVITNMHKKLKISYKAYEGLERDGMLKYSSLEDAIIAVLDISIVLLEKFSTENIDGLLVYQESYRLRRITIDDLSQNINKKKINLSAPR